MTILFKKLISCLVMLVFLFSIYPVQTLAIDQKQKALWLNGINHYDYDIGCLNVAPSQTTPLVNNVYMLGDSITAGSETSLNRQFSEKTITATINASVSRSINRDGQTEGKKNSGLEAVDVDKDVIASAQAVVIALGTNSDGSAENYTNSMARLIEKIKSFNGSTKIYVVNIFSQVPHKGSYNEVLDTLESAPTVIDTVNQSISLTSDNIHPDTEGQQTFATTVVESVAGGTDVSASGSSVNGSNGCVCSTGERTSSSIPGADNEEKVWNYMISKGIKPVTAAGILGNFAEESSFDPHVQEIGQTPPWGGYGIAQWTGTGKSGDPAGARRLNLIKFIEKAGISVDYGVLKATEPVDKEALLLAQLDFMFKEGASIINAMKSISDPGEAARYWMNEYERPRNRVQPAREAAARAALEKYGGRSGSVTITTTSSGLSPGTSCAKSGDGSDSTANVTADGYALPVKKEGVNLPCNSSTCHHDGTPAADLGITPAWEGTPVYAITAGKIENLHYRAGFGRQGPAPQECISFQLVGDDGWQYWYGHIREPKVRNGDKVKAGQLLAVIGQSRCADDTPPHLHIDRGSPKGRAGGSECCRDPGFIPLLNKIYNES